MVRARVLMTFLVIAALVGTTIQDQLSGASPEIRNAIQPFWDQGFACRAYLGGEPWPYPQWQCDRTGEGVRRTIKVDTVRDQVMGVVGEIRSTGTSGLDPAFAAVFVDQVATIPLGGPTAQVRRWVAEHLTEGGRTSIGRTGVFLGIAEQVIFLSLGGTG